MEGVAYESGGSVTSLRMQARRFWHILNLSFRYFRRSYLAAAISVAAAASGTGGVIVCTGYAAAGRQKIIDQLERMGTNVIVVTPQQSRAVGGRARTGTIVTTLRESDYRAVREAAAQITSASPTVSAVLRLRAGDLTRNTTVVGCEPEYFRIRNWPVRMGTLFDSADERAGKRVILLGATAALDLFGPVDPTGERISVNRVPFTIAGVLSERGQGLDAADEDSQVYVPLQTAMKRLMNVDYFGSILFQIGSWRDMDEAEQEIGAELERRHRIVSLGGPDFQIENQKSLIETQLAATERFTFLLRWIAASTLGVSSMGIFGVAWIGIGHRTREIGTCRALGATVQDILVQFFAEGIAGPALGCACGVTIARIVLQVIDARAGQPFLFAPRTTAVAAGLSMLLFALSTMASCLRAVGIAPSIALRAE